MIFASAAALAAMSYWLWTAVRERDRLRGARDRFREEATKARHDLRTPATAIKGFAIILKSRWETLPAAKRAEYLDVIAEESDKLGAMVDRLFKE